MAIKDNQILDYVIVQVLQKNQHQNDMKFARIVLRRRPMRKKMGRELGKDGRAIQL